MLTVDAVRSLSEKERERVMQLAIGRLFAMGSRPSQPCDVAEYERIRAIVLDIAGDAPAAWHPDYARDRLRGST